MEPREKLEAELEEAGLLPYYTAFKSCVKNAIRLHQEPVSEDRIPVGASKIGGRPDLPAGIAWFRHAKTGLPLSFVCQLNFAELRLWDLDRRLPDRGMLYLFYDYSEDGMPWGFDPTDSDGWAVYYSDAEASGLTRAEAPADLEENGVLFGAASLFFSCRMELPHWESSLWEGISVSDEVRDRLFDWYEKGGEAPISKVLGHSDNIQGGMELECEIIANGLSAGDGRGYEEARRRGLERCVGRWSLLLQIDSSEELGMEWGDCGRIYLWITEQDLSDRAFEKAWLILQCF